jgi:hypothetical protein
MMRAGTSGSRTPATMSTRSAKYNHPTIPDGRTIEVLRRATTVYKGACNDIRATLNDKKR